MQHVSTSVSRYRAWKGLLPLLQFRKTAFDHTNGIFVSCIRIRWLVASLFVVLVEHLTADLQFFPGNEFDESRGKLNTRYARHRDDPPSPNPNRHQEPLFDGRLKNRNSTLSCIAASYHKRLSISSKVVGTTYRPPHYGCRGAHKYVETVA